VTPVAVYLNAADIAARAGVSKSLVSLWVHTGRIPVAATTPRGTPLFREQDVGDWLFRWQARRKRYRRLCYAVEGLDEPAPRFECGVPPPVCDLASALHAEWLRQVVGHGGRV